MSTTIKRIALVAVAALGLGVMSVAPSQANNTILQFGTGDSAGTTNATGFAVAGAFNFATVNVVSGAADYVLTTDSTFVGQGDASPLGTLAPDAKSLSMTDTTTTGIRVATPIVGTVTVKYWVRTNGQLAATAAQTVTITVNATAQSGAFSAANSTSIMASGETTTMPIADATVNTVSTIKLDTAAATVKVVLQDSLKKAYDDTVTATVVNGSANVKVLLDSESTTVGVSSDATSAVPAGTASSSVKTGTSGIAYVLIYSSGIAGPATVRISLSDGTVIANKTVTFSSTTIASITPTVVYARVTGDAGAPTTATGGSTAAGAITLSLKDAAGYAISGATITSATPDVTTFISSVQCGASIATGVSSCTVVPVAAKYGTTVITFKSGTAVTATASITTAAAKASTITVSAPASVEAGSEVEFTFTAKDSTGAALADGAYAPGAFLASASSSATNFAFATTDTITVTAGVATAKVYAPYITGTWQTTHKTKGTAATATAVAVGTSNVADALAGATVVTNVAITNAGTDAALDAANEAATAAQDATDAAIQAADAADEATAAVAALSLEVNTLIAGLKSQLTTLYKMFIKLRNSINKK